MKNFVYLFFCSCFIFLSSFEGCFGQEIKYDVGAKKLHTFRDSVSKVIKEKALNLTIGIGIAELKESQTYSEGFYSFYSNSKIEESLYKNNLENFPTMSVYKFHLALAILNQVDKGKFNLNDELRITNYDLLENTYSPLRDNLKKEYEETYNEKTKNGISIRLNELLSYSVSKSDNNACDILFRLLGGKNYLNNEGESAEIRRNHTQKGVEKTNTFIQKLGLKSTFIAASEQKMHESFENQYLNTSTPLDAVLLLKHFYNGKILEEKTKDFLWKLLVETETGSNKIRAGLPQKETIILGHKTGSSFRKELTEGQEFGLEFGLKAAENDIGIVITPTKSYAIAIFIKNSTESNETNNALIAELSKMIFEFIN